MSEWEMAMLKHRDGSPVARSAAQRSFQVYQRALARAGGRHPVDADGCRLVWNEARGWHRPSDQPPPVAGTRVADAQRQLDALCESDRAIERMHNRLMAKREAEARQQERDAARRDQAALELYAVASTASLDWMKRYNSGWQGSPRPDIHEMTGRQLHLAFPNGPTLTAQCARRERVAREWERQFA